MRETCSCTGYERALWDAVREYMVILVGFAACIFLAPDALCAATMPMLLNAQYVMARAMDEWRMCSDRCHDSQWYRAPAAPAAATLPHHPWRLTWRAI